MRTSLVAGGWVELHEQWLDPASADELLSWLRDHVQWTQASLSLFGREVREPRLSAWFGDKSYTYSGRTLAAQPFPERLEAVRQRIEAACDARFNSVLLNRYRDGADSMGFHADDEPELGRDPVIASLSLGATRRFLVRAKRRAEAASALDLDLSHGSLLVMGGTLQHHHRHALPKRPALRDERINLTFRRILG